MTSSDMLKRFVLLRIYHVAAWNSRFARAQNSVASRFLGFVNLPQRLHNCYAKGHALNGYVMFRNGVKRLGAALAGCAGIQGGRSSHWTGLHGLNSKTMAELRKHINSAYACGVVLVKYEVSGYSGILNGEGECHGLR